MTNESRADVSCPLVAEYVDEAEIPANFAYHQGEVIRPQVVAVYVDDGLENGAVARLNEGAT